MLVLATDDIDCFRRAFDPGPATTARVAVPPFDRFLRVGFAPKRLHGLMLQRLRLVSRFAAPEVQCGHLEAARIVADAVRR